MLKRILFGVVVIILKTCSATIELNEDAAKLYIDSLEFNRTRMKNKAAIASWNYESFLSDENKKINKQTQIEAANFDKSIAETLMLFDWHKFTDVDLKRKIKKLSDLGDAILPIERFKALQNAISDMQTNFAEAKFCSYDNENNCNISLEPELLEIFQKSQNAEELKYYWVQWYNLAGSKVVGKFEKYVELKNEAARMNSENLTLNK